MASEQSVSIWRRRRLVLECAGAQLVADTAACRRLTAEVEETLQHWQERLEGREQRMEAQVRTSRLVGQALEETCESSFLLLKASYITILKCGYIVMPFDFFHIVPNM